MSFVGISTSQGGVLQRHERLQGQLRTIPEQMVKILIVFSQFLIFLNVKNYNFCQSDTLLPFEYRTIWIPTVLSVQLNVPGTRDSGNDVCFSDFASHTGRFHLIFVCISSLVSFWVDIRQLSLFLICHFSTSNYFFSGRVLSFIGRNECCFWLFLLGTLRTKTFLFVYSRNEKQQKSFPLSLL